MPSTDWKEVIPPGEDARLAAHAESLREIQRRVSAKSGAGRALHRKGWGYEATFEVVADVPAELKVGVFEKPRTFAALVRFSNGSGKRQADRTGDVRGVAIKLLEVDGPKALPGSSARTQDFLGVLSSSVPFRNADEFVGLVTAASGSPLLLLPRLMAVMGVGRALGVAQVLAKSLKNPPATLAGSTFYSALPIRFGPFAARYSLKPVGELPAPSPSADPDYLARDLADRLTGGPLSWDFLAQFYENPATTPIEDPSIDWPTPYIKLARLTLPKQDGGSERGRKIAERCEGLAFDPWHALEVHRPLGNMMRARKHAYFLSTQERKAAPEPATGDPLA